MPLIELRNVSVVYGPKTPYEVKALTDVSLSIESSEFVGIIGPTGSGKSTLIQLMNGLIKPDKGEVLVEGVRLSELKGSQLKEIRKKVGLVFQYPENQVFEETVEREIAYGPRNLGLNREEIQARVVKAMDYVGMDYGEYRDRSPFGLSGGQLRRIAIASILAMEPQVLILDEPTAGMDPQSRRDILDRITGLHREREMTVVLVSHNMEDVARLAKKIFVLSEGRLVMEGTPRDIFSQPEKVRRLGLEIPAMTDLMVRLSARGAQVRTDVFTESAARDELLKHLKGAGNA
jgi:energy-coupling factor transport system ATP-binding protein